MERKILRKLIKKKYFYKKIYDKWERLDVTNITLSDYFKSDNKIIVYWKWLRLENEMPKTSNGKVLLSELTNKKVYKI